MKSEVRGVSCVHLGHFRVRNSSQLLSSDFSYVRAALLRAIIVGYREAQ